MESLQSEGSFLFKYGTVYRKALNLPLLDICEFFRAPDRKNVLAHQMFKFYNESRDGLRPFYGCPYRVGNIPY
jgi:hypothetical protein